MSDLEHYTTIWGGNFATKLSKMSTDYDVGSAWLICVLANFARPWEFYAKDRGG
jgi:hypothetical protein